MIAYLLDNAPSAYFSILDNGNIYIVNQTLCDVLGYEKNELEGKAVENIFTIPTKIFYQTHLFPLVKMQGFAEEVFLTLLSKTGDHIPALLNAKRIINEEISITACSFIIVHNRKKFEDELVAARKKAEKALNENSLLLKARAELQEHAEELDEQMHIVNERNQELKQLNHVITHNLKEPLRKILLYTDRLKLNPMPDETNKVMEKLTRSSLQMKNIVAGLQQYVWLDDASLHFSKVNPEEIIRHACEELINENGEKKLEIHIRKLPEIEADPSQLKLLFYHLLSNAIKFRKGEKAFVTIRGTMIQKNRFQSMKHKYSFEDFLKIEFADEGTGFDNLRSDSAFELFRKLHISEGAGVGLALCKKIAGNHSGHISISSILNKGTTVELLLPVSQKNIFQDNPSVTAINL